MASFAFLYFYAKNSWHLPLFRNHILTLRIRSKCCLVGILEVEFSEDPVCKKVEKYQSESVYWSAFLLLHQTDNLQFKVFFEIIYCNLFSTLSQFLNIDYQWEKNCFTVFYWMIDFIRKRPRLFNSFSPKICKMILLWHQRHDDIRNFKQSTLV